MLWLVQGALGFRYTYGHVASQGGTVGVTGRSRAGAGYMVCPIFSAQKPQRRGGVYNERYSTLRIKRFCRLHSHVEIQRDTSYKFTYF